MQWRESLVLYKPFNTLCLELYQWLICQKQKHIQQVLWAEQGSSTNGDNKTTAKKCGILYFSYTVVCAYLNRCHRCKLGDLPLQSLLSEKQEKKIGTLSCHIHRLLNTNPFPWTKSPILKFHRQYYCMNTQAIFRFLPFIEKISYLRLQHSGF